MRKITFLLLALICLDSFAQTTMRDVLKAMPDSMVPYLSANNLLDMIDFSDTNMDAVVTNSLGGRSQMNKLTDDFVSIRLNESSDIAMRLLHVDTPVDSAQKIVCMVSTYGTDIRESTISFYSLKWKPLSVSDYIELPEDMTVATLSDQDAQLTFCSENGLDARANEEQKEISKQLTTFNWNEKFVKEF